jgi:prophage regulatory protein
MRYARQRKNLAQLAPAVAQQLDQLQEAISSLGAEIGAVVIAAQQEQTERRQADQEQEHPESDHHVIAESSPTRGYRAGQIAKRLSVHPQTLWRWIREGRFPKGIKIGPMTTIWTEAMLAGWLEKQKVKEISDSERAAGKGKAAQGDC